MLCLRSPCYKLTILIFRFVTLNIFTGYYFLVIFYYSCYLMTDQGRISSGLREVSTGHRSSGQAHSQPSQMCHKVETLFQYLYNSGQIQIVQCLLMFQCFLSFVIDTRHRQQEVGERDTQHICFV